MVSIFSTLKLQLAKNISERKNLYEVSVIQALRIFLFPLIILFIATRIPEYEFGIFALGITIAQLIIVICDFGFNQRIVLIGNGTKPNITQMTNFIFLRLLIIFFLLSISIYLINIFYSDFFIEYLIFCCSGIAYSIFNFFSAYFRAGLNFKIELHGYVLSNFILVIGLIFIENFFIMTTLNLAIIFFVARLLPMIFSVYMFLADTRKMKFQLNLKDLTSELKKVLPIAAITILAFLYIYIDLFLIEFYLGFEEVGQYQVAFRLIILTMIIPEIFNHLMLPFLSKLWKKDPINYFLTLRISLIILFLYSIIATSLIAIFSKPVISLIFLDKYSISGEIILYMLPLIILRSLGAPLGLRLLIENLAYYRLFFMLLVTFFTIICNIIVIPMYGLYGVVFTSIIAHIILNALYWSKLRRWRH